MEPSSKVIELCKVLKLGNLSTTQQSIDTALLMTTMKAKKLTSPPGRRAAYRAHAIAWVPEKNCKPTSSHVNHECSSRH
jgi:hypothetical protein